MEALVSTAAVAGHAWFLYQGYDAIASGRVAAANVNALAPVVGPVAYIVAVQVGKRLVRSPLGSCKASMAVYNLYATALSAVMLYLLGSHLWALGVPGMFTTLPGGGAAGRAAAAAVWLNYQSKYLEYMDTAFMVARVKHEQISGLHVIHHAVMAPLVWLFCTEWAWGNSAFGPAINSFIHTIMYSYYGLTGLGFKLPLAWKQSLTSSQLAQFVVILVHSTFHIVFWNAYWSGKLAVLEMLLMFLMLYMFSAFFIEKYGGGGKKDKAAKKAA